MEELSAFYIAVSMDGVIYARCYKDLSPPERMIRTGSVTMIDGYARTNNIIIRYDSSRYHGGSSVDVGCTAPFRCIPPLPLAPEITHNRGLTGLLAFVHLIATNET